VKFRRRSIASLGLLACLALGAALPAGCWQQSEISKLDENSAYLRLLGNVAGVELALDGGGRLKLVDSAGQVVKEGTLWRIQPGRHIVELYRDGAQILRRDLYVARGQTLDVEVP
jgi:hypothetical protein